MEEVLKKIISKESKEFFELVYEDMESSGKAITEEYKKGLKKYSVKKNIRYERLENKIKTVCDNNISLEKEIKELLKEYIEIINSESSYQIKHYYEQGIKDGVIIVTDIFYEK